MKISNNLKGFVSFVKVTYMALCITSTVTPFDPFKVTFSQDLYLVKINVLRRGCEEM